VSHLTEAEKKKLCALIERGEPLPAAYKGKLFGPEDSTFFQATKEYRLVYAGKTRREEVIADTPEAPFQLVRSFNSDNSFPNGWRNMLIYGDNLLALKALYADQRGLNRYRTKDRIKLIYIDPPFATKQDFMKDREKAYRDKVIGAEFIEFLRKRLILLRELLADDGSKHFDFAVHQILFSEITGILRENGALDLITLTQRLRDRELLEEVGGPAYLSDLICVVTTTTGIEKYVDKIADRHRL
jgi:site-specific DNA-methyltransferase (adenine-specific)/adenine-specific DNA-methyltransferase